MFARPWDPPIVIEQSRVTTTTKHRSGKIEWQPSLYLQVWGILGIV
jgi:hypothetical protein